MNAKCYLEGPEYSEFRYLPSGNKIETLNWIGEKGGAIILKYWERDSFGKWPYPETKNFIYKVYEGNHCIGVQNRADILKELFDSFPIPNGDSEIYEQRFSQAYFSACLDRCPSLSEFDFSSP